MDIDDICIAFKKNNKKLMMKLKFLKKNTAKFS